MYGSLKMWPHLQRQGITVARCTGGADHVEQTVGSGVTRAEQVRTTISDPAADRAPDLVNRQFRVSGPNALFFADVTYGPMDTGVFACTAFVIDAPGRSSAGDARPAEPLAAWLTDAWTRLLPVGVPACRVPAPLR